MPKSMSDDAKDIILNVLAFMREEKRTQTLLIPIVRLFDRVAAATGVNQSSVRRLVKERDQANESVNVSAKRVSAIRESDTEKSTPGKRRNMGKDEKEDSGFGFKDKAKAEETLRLLEEHDMNYRRLTVRGLLGRAKRVLSLTKAEEKIKNIKEAMEVFENWIAELDKNKEGTQKKPVKKDKEDKRDAKDDSDSDVDMEESKEKKAKKELPPDTVPGLGFKDKEATDNTLRELEGRDPDYQKLAVRGLIGRAKRVLTCTRDETKIANIKESISIYEKFLDDFETQHLSKQNNPYLPLGIVRTCLRLAGDNITEQQKSFIDAYASVNGEYKRLRTVLEKDDGKSWDIVRNAALKDLKEKYVDAKLYNEKDEPTKEHLELLLWAYSPDAARVKKVIPEPKSEEEEPKAKEKKHNDSDRKRRHSDEESPSKKKKE
ncbi:uncharacterized protein LOC110996169 isoform X1 [Pieris rapae]|uniref:uncharacterized protein LOC110996169 isoform X1 n=2 Tax=Pieris rapae TaxID=64459 RepID=UPI001E27F120|nr:uncharacterized protein LOC110996169 isoform X1 [Pieris rapae]